MGCSIFLYRLATSTATAFAFSFSAFASLLLAAASSSVVWLLLAGRLYFVSRLLLSSRLATACTSSGASFSFAVFSLSFLVRVYLYTKSFYYVCFNFVSRVLFLFKRIV